MASTFFVDTVTHIEGHWANDVNTLVYTIFGGAQTKKKARDGLGVTDLATLD